MCKGKDHIDQLPNLTNCQSAVVCERNGSEGGSYHCTISARLANRDLNQTDYTQKPDDLESNSIDVRQRDHLHPTEVRQIGDSPVFRQVT